MQQRKGIIYPRIVEEVVDYQELIDLWGCSYNTCFRVLRGLSAPNHKRKKALSEYLGIPMDELWLRVDQKPTGKLSEDSGNDNQG